MKVIVRLIVCAFGIAAALLMLVAYSPGRAADWRKNQAFASTCKTTKPITLDQIRAMPTAMLYEFYQTAHRASDMWANAVATGAPLDPCVVAIAIQMGDFERELKYR